MFKRLVVLSLFVLCLVCGIREKTAMASAFDRKIDSVIQKLVEQENKAMAATFRRLKTMQKEVLAELPTKKTEWRDYHLKRVKEEIDLIVDEQFAMLTADLTGREKVFWELGTDIVAAPLSVAGIESQIFGLNIQALQAIQSDAGELVVGISRELKNKIKLELSKVSSGLQTPFDAIEKLAVGFDDPGIFTSTWHRAEMVVRNELNHVSSVADNQAMQEASQFLGDRLKKRWVHSRNPNGRETHIAAESQVIGVKERYRVAPKFGKPVQLLRYPRDWKYGTASNNVNCGCDSAPVLAEAA